ncbi:CAF17-like 4Fe-4S cluster assembly/insertion protein YgfZ [Polynucleobacter alcilacus]|uniref:CAF17-like 4Fe-4S cluster assembly/insertion protein YgfZ n=1 Tax=Polynucleobacter alcilacus TaxID=1819739 RepID=UPI001C0DBE5E|nr:folate-binding protein [Polynucleobacter alcilacus]MBU3566805.1 folate-binding protein YgfZ [Polynucleobacter alcilacus]
MTKNPQNTPNLSGTDPLAHSLLPEWGLIFVEGLDAASFLQNQLSNSVLGLQRTASAQVAQSHESVRLVGYCSPKGRLIASAWLALFPSTDNGEDRFALFISKDIAAVTAKRLSMYVLRSKAKVTDMSSSWTVAGFYGNDQAMAALKIEKTEIALRLPDVLSNNQSDARVLIGKPNAEPEKIGNEHLVSWNHLEVMSAIPRIVLATQEQFVPQMINFESVAGVDFQKGCYPGQEIVARSQYRGAIKRRLQLAHISADSLGNQEYGPGVELFHTSDPAQPAGMVVLASPSPSDPSRIDLQAECKLDALQSGEIHLGSVHGPVLKIDSLPYPLIEI